MTRMPAATIMTTITATTTTAAITMNTTAVTVSMAIVRGITATEIDVDDPIGLRGCKGSWIYSGPLVGDHYTQTDWGYACRRSLPWSPELYSIVKLPEL